MLSMISFFTGFRIDNSYDKDRSDRVIRSNPIRLYASYNHYYFY